MSTYKDRVAALWTGTGPGTLTVGGVPDGTWQSFPTALNDGDSVVISIYGAGAFEVCESVWNESAGTLSRGTLIASSTGSRISFGAGQKVVVITVPAAHVADFIWAGGAQTLAASKKAQAQKNVAQAKVAFSSNNTITTNHRGAYISLTNSPTIAFQDAATLGDGFVCAIGNDGSGAPVLDPNGSQQIDNALTLTLGPGDRVLVFCDGTAIRTIRGRGTATFLTAATTPPAAPSRVGSTNLLSVPYFNDQPWNITKSNADMVSFCYNASQPVSSSFGNRAAQMAVSAGAHNMAHPSDFRIDKTKAYQLGFWGHGGGTVNLLVASLNAISQELATTTISTVAVPTNPVGLITGGGNNTGNSMVTMNPTAGSAPKWDAAAVGAAFRIENPSGNKFICAAYVVAHDQWPANIAVGSIPSQANGGVGTHEAVYDPATGLIYVISHSYDCVVKMDAATLIKPASNFVAATGSYAHDITLLGGHIYVACFNGETVNKIDKSTMAVVASYPSAGRAMISCCHNGTDILIGSGTPAQTPFIIKLTVATGSYNIVSGDCGGGLANLPVRVLQQISTNEVWTVKTANSEVKRINIGGGGTIATYACNMGAIYGLGEDNTPLIYANCDEGIAVIDPTAATPGGVGTVLKKYPFRMLYGGASNPRVDDFGRMWGTTNSGIWMLDHANGRLWEMPRGFLGGPKFVCRVPGIGMVLGYYVMPSLDILR